MTTTITDRLSGNPSSSSDPLPAYGFTGLAVLASADEVELASAAAVDLLGSAALVSRITGSATITSLGTDANRIKLARFTGAATLTHNATSLILPGGTDIVAAAGDTMLVTSDESGNARVVAYQKADGTALSGVDFASVQTLSNKTFSSPALNGAVSGSAVLDEDDMASDSDTQVATQQSIKAYRDSLLTTENQALTGGATVTSKSLGTVASGTLTLDMGDRPLQHYTNGGAHTLAPGAVVGSCIVDIVNNGSAGAITTSGWTRVGGDSFTTTDTHAFRCHCSVGQQGSLLVVQAMQ